MRAYDAPQNCMGGKKWLVPQNWDLPVINIFYSSTLYTITRNDSTRHASHDAPGDMRRFESEFEQAALGDRDPYALTHRRAPTRRVGATREHGSLHAPRSMPSPRVAQCDRTEASGRRREAGSLGATFITAAPRKKLRLEGAAAERAHRSPPGMGPPSPRRASCFGCSFESVASKSSLGSIS